MSSTPGRRPARRKVKEPAQLASDRYFNRELSWLDFNGRVLELAEDTRVPLLERMKFVAIFASNLDEFFMVRISGLHRRLQTGLPPRYPDQLPPRTALELIAEKSSRLVARAAKLFAGEIRPALQAAGIEIVAWSDLDNAECERLHAYFHDRIFPLLTPLAVDPAHPFPYISGLSLNLATVVRDPETGEEHFARVKMPDNVPRFVTVTSDGRTGRFLPLEELAIRAEDLPNLPGRAQPRTPI